jgi:hypothetical protein
MIGIFEDVGSKKICGNEETGAREREFATLCFLL